LRRNPLFLSKKMLKHLPKAMKRNSHTPTPSSTDKTSTSPPLPTSNDITETASSNSNCIGGGWAPMEATASRVFAFTDLPHPTITTQNDTTVAVNKSAEAVQVDGPVARDHSSGEDDSNNYSNEEEQESKSDGGQDGASLQQGRSWEEDGMDHGKIDNNRSWNENERPREQVPPEQEQKRRWEEDEVQLEQEQKRRWEVQQVEETVEIESVKRVLLSTDGDDSVESMWQIMDSKSRLFPFETLHFRRNNERV
jgi:hypothetical protein